MSIEGNKTAIKRLSEVINTRNWSALPELFTPDYVGHFKPDAKGPEGVKQQFTSMTPLFPDYRENIERMVAEEEMVAVYYTISGTLTGKSPGVTPTGKKFSMPYHVLARFSNGKQVEAWAYGDELAYYRQLGIPIPDE
jgi:predicted ester cyclase